MPELKAYQTEGVKFALRHRNVIIADEMGLGKTVQAIAYINARPELSTVLIVCPKSLRINWENELKVWLNPRDELYVTVVHYERLEKVKSYPVDLLIVDEAQFIKNAKTSRHQRVKAFSKIAKHTMLLTGTPFENKVVELWPLLQILKPEVWDKAGTIYQKNDKGVKVPVKVGMGEGAGFLTFAKSFCGAKKIWFLYGRPIAAADLEMIRPPPNPKFIKSHWDFSGASNLEELRDWLKKTGMIRRYKADVLPQLPPKQRQVIVLPNEALEPPILQSYSDKLADDGSNFEEVVAALRADKVAFTEWSKKRVEQGKAKVGLVAEYVIQCIENGAEKIIVFAQHVEVMISLTAMLREVGAVCMTSDMAVEERQATVDVFCDDPNCKVIIGGFGVMGTGYTMTVASMVVFAEIDPVPGRLMQAEDRAHRIGLKWMLLCVYLVLDGTLDANICKIAVKKMGILKEVLG